MTRGTLATLAAILAASCVLAASSVANASHIWRGDYSTGDTSQWTKEELVSPDRLRVVPDPLGSGRQALRTKVMQGDDPIGASGNRNEVVYRGDTPREGQERFYRWQTLFPADFEAADTWQIFTQWHQYAPGGSPPMAFMVWGDRIQVGSPEEYFWQVPLEKGQWHDFMVRVVWSSDPGVGGIEIWYDGEHSLPFTHAATLFPNDTVYLKQGLYRKDVIGQPQVVYHAGMVVATSLDDVRDAPLLAGGSDPGSGGNPLAPSAAVPGVTVLGADAAGGCSAFGAAGLPLAAPLAWLGLRRLRRRR